MICLTAAGAVDFVNGQVLDYFGRPLEELKELAHTDVVHPDDRRRAIAVGTRSIARGEPYDVEIRLRRVDGVYRWFHIRSLPVRDGEGRIRRWCVLQADIDVRKSAEQLLRSTRRKLSAAMQIAAVAELSASIAHEVNQPLASVVANAHACQTWLSHDPPNFERAQATLERIMRDGACRGRGRPQDSGALQEGGSAGQGAAGCEPDRRRGAARALR